MALVYADRVRETTTTAGTGAYTLAGASTGFQSFSDGVGSGNTCYYCAENGVDWEVGLGTLSGGSSLARTSITASSNGGSAVDWPGTVKSIFVTVPAPRVDQMPKGHMQGLRVAYGSATTVTIDAGECRDSTDTRNIYIDAPVTVSITSVGALGLDEATLNATATTHGTAAFEPSASIFSETALSSTVRTLTGTGLAGASTTITGTATKFLSEVAVGDVIRSSAKGAARVTAIASDTSLTIAAAFPGGNPSGDAGAITLYENLIVRIAAETPQRVNTISHAGTSVAVPSSWSSSTSGVTIKLGGEIVSAWYFLFVRYGGSGTTGALSTQRTKPYPLSGYDTACRRVGSAYNNSSGNIDLFRESRVGNASCVFWDALHRPLSAGTATAFTDVSLADHVSPCANQAILILQTVSGATPSNFSSARPNEGVDTIGPLRINGMANLSPQVIGELPLDRGAIVEYAINQAARTDQIYLDVLGYREAL